MLFANMGWFVQLTAADYAPYAAVLASAGYTTVQYDINQLLAMVPDLEEVQRRTLCWTLLCAPAQNRLHF